MIYFKRALAGIVTLFIAMIVYVVSLMAVLLRKYAPPPGVHVAFALGSLLRRPSFWFIAVAAFALGFYWEFRRAI